MEQKHAHRRQLWFWFGLYVILMLYFLFFQRIADRGAPDRAEWMLWSVNWVPGKTVVLYLRAARLAFEGSLSAWMLWYAAVNLVGNLVVFVPLGIFLPALWPWQRKWLRCLLTSAVLIAAVELIQLATMLGSCDIDDWILNLLGVMAGFAAYTGYQKKRKKRAA